MTRLLTKEVVLIVIIFQNETARLCLLTRHYVFTYRSKLRRIKDGPDCMTDKRGHKAICDIEVYLVCPCKSMGVLNHFVSGSGFSDVEAWLKAIEEIHESRKLDGYIYLVKTLCARAGRLFSC